MKRVFSGILLSAALAYPQVLWACAVCFGDPESSLSQGAIAGVLVLLGVVVCVLGGIAGMAVFWMRRASRARPAHLAVSSGYPPALGMATASAAAGMTPSHPDS